MKNFDERLKQQFTKIKIEVPDATKHLIYLYADFVELIALFSNNSYVTETDILDRLKDEGETNILDIISSEAAEDGDDEEIPESKKNDLKERWVNELFSLIEDRVAIYNENYPFNYDLKRGFILKDNIQGKQELYLFLLIASNLDSFNKIGSELTKDFELVSFYSLKEFLPAYARVESFGKNTIYTGNAISKIKRLASEMRLDINENSLRNISEKNNQERGLDVVGWLPFKDSCPNIITILGQCTCEKNWPKKYHDTKRFETYMKYFRLKPIHAMFIPYSLIIRNSSWFDRSDDIERNTIMFERKRILELFNEQQAFEVLDSKKIVESCVAYQEDIV